MPNEHARSTELAARRAAIEIIDGVLGRRRQLDEAIALSKTLPNTSELDRAFTMHLVRTGLRRLGQIDALIDHCLQKPLPAKAVVVRHILRIGLTQLLFSDTPPHAAISTTVDLCRAVGMEGYAKLVNAIMRRVQREGDRMQMAQDPAHLNTPTWLWESWERTYGREITLQIANQHLEPAPLDLSVVKDPETWAEKLGGDVVLENTVRVANNSNVASLPGFSEGAWWVQDVAASLPIRLLGELNGLDVYDLCAAPGGKTLSLSAAGGNVTAVDISEKRLARLRENLSRTRYKAEVVCADVREWAPMAPADVVVLDAPCSATGTIRRHPDLPRLKTAADIDKLKAVQDALLARAGEMTKPGGILLYVTCSLQPEEGPERIDAFLSAHSAFTRQPILANELPTLPSAITASGDLRTLPHFLNDRGGMDGFFAARLRKTNA